MEPTFLDVIYLLDECIKHGILVRQEDSVFIYHEASETDTEGWYLDNIHSVARDSLGWIKEFWKKTP